MKTVQSTGPSATPAAPPPGAQTPPLQSNSEPEFLEFVCPSLLKYNYDDWKVKLGLFAGASAVQACIVLVTLFLVHLYLGKKVTFKKKNYIMSFIVRAPFGVYATAYGAYTIFFSSVLSNDVVHGRTISSVVFVVITCSIYYTDTFLLLLHIYFFKVSSQLVLEHHLLIMSTYTLMAIYDCGYFFGVAFLTIEIVAVPVFITVYMRTITKSQGLGGKIMGFFTCHTFHARNFIEGYVVFKIVYEWNYITEAMPTSLLISMIVMIGAIFLVLTPVWTYMTSEYNFNPTLQFSPEDLMKKDKAKSS